MAVIKADPFTYSNGHLSVVEANWVQPWTEGFDVSTNALVPQITSSDLGNVWQGDTWPDDQYGQVAVSGGAAGDDDQSGVGILLRYTDTTHHFRIVVNGRASNNVTVAQMNGTYSQLAQITQAFSAGDTLKAQVIGTSPPTIKVFRNGSQIGSDVTTGAAAIASGDVGMYYSSTAAGMGIDNFEGGDAATAGPQLLLPSADSVDGAWTDQAGGTSLAAAIDEATASDTDYIRSELGPANSACRVKLASGGDPQSSSGHILHWRVGKDTTGGASIAVTCKLYQGGGNSIGGGTLIKSWTRSNVDAFTTYDETALTSGEADSITNYGDLYLEFSANQT